MKQTGKVSGNGKARPAPRPSGGTSSKPQAKPTQPAQPKQQVKPAQRPGGTPKAQSAQPDRQAKPVQRPGGTPKAQSAQPDRQAKPVQRPSGAPKAQHAKPNKSEQPVRGGVGRSQPVRRPNGKAPSAPQAKPAKSVKQAKPQKQKKERADKLKAKKKKEKNPNRIRFLSFEGRVDIPMLIITLVLLAFGMTMMFSASHAYSYRDFKGDSYGYISRQMWAAGIGLAGMVFLTLFDYRFLRRESKNRHITAAHIFLIACVLMNLYCGFFGIEADGGQKRWLSLPLVNQFQPSDFLKIAVVIFMAYYIHENAERLRTFYGGLVKPILIMIPVVTSIMVQMHLSCLIIILVLFAIMLFVGGVNLKEALPIAGLVILAAYIAIFVVKVGYFNQRIEFMDPLSDPGDQSYQNYQSALAIGSGGFWGKGFGNSSQKYYYLPEAQNDFVYAILVEEFGFIGGMFVIILFIIFVMRGLYIARKAEDKFGCLMATGITIQIGLQALLNIAVNLCCIPNTGVSLPFFSYGGTALVLQLWEMGLLLAISKRANVK